MTVRQKKKLPGPRMNIKPRLTSIPAGISLNRKPPLKSLVKTCYIQCPTGIDDWIFRDRTVINLRFQQFHQASDGGSNCRSCSGPEWLGGR